MLQPRDGPTVFVWKFCTELPLCTLAREAGESGRRGGGVGCDSLGIRIIQVLCLQERRIVPSSRCSFDPLLRVRGPRCVQPTNAFVFVPEQLLSARCASVAKTRAEPRVDLAEKKRRVRHAWRLSLKRLHGPCARQRGRKNEKLRRDSYVYRSRSFPLFFLV